MGSNRPYRNFLCLNIGCNRDVNYATLFGSSLGDVWAAFGFNFDKNFGIISGRIRRLQIKFSKTSFVYSV